VGTVNGRTSRSAYTPVRLRGRIFRDVTEAPPQMQPGDEILITDMSRLRPKNVFSERSEKGKWWLRGYTTSDQPQEQFMVCVQEWDPVDPASCLAPQFEMPLNFTGWYEVWIQGSLDVRLSGEKHFLACSGDETLYRAADLTGQYLVFRQVGGTYDSVRKRCQAVLLGVRLVKLSDEQVTELQAERARQDTNIIGYDNDGFSSFWHNAVHDRACIARLLEPLRDQSVAFLNISLGGVGGITIPTPYTGLYQMSSSSQRDGDFRANAFFRWCYENDVNILDVLTEYGHQVGVKIFAALMMERSFSRDDTMHAHPEWRVKRGRGTWDYAIPEVHDYQIKKIAWIIENYDIDGFTIDFTRYGHYFNEDEPNKFEHMNNFVRKLRAAVDEVNANREHKCLLCASFGERSWHLTHWGSGKLDDQGLDIKTWLEEGIFDIIMPEGPTVLHWMKLGENSRTQIWPRMVAGVTLSTHTKAEHSLGPKEIEKEVKWAFDHGAPGIFFFNQGTWTTLGRLGFKEELDLRTKVDELYGQHQSPGPEITYTQWHPGWHQKNAQRIALRKPLTIAVDADGQVDSDLTIPIRNTFDHPVTAVVIWLPGEDENAEPWTITPESEAADIAPGEEGHIVFHLKGSGVRYKAVPRPDIRMAAEGQEVFHDRLRLHAVPRMICKQVSSAPTIDGDLGDEAWASVGGLQPIDLWLVDQTDKAPWKTQVAVAYDEDNLYLAYECSGLDVSKLDREVYERDTNRVYGRDYLGVLIDPEGTESGYLRFQVTPAGTQADFRNYFYSLGGRLVEDLKWNADWTAGTAWRDDGYAIELAIPFAALDATPQPGDVWRGNIVVRADGSGFAVVDAGFDQDGVTASWSSAKQPFHLPRNHGTLHGTLVFQ